jgi:hypothetical protein
MFSSQSDYVYSKRFSQDIAKCYLKGDPGAKGETGESGTASFKGDKGDTGASGTNGLSGARGNIAIVDSVNGNDSNGTVGGLPFLTLEGALSSIQTGQQIQVLPGTYTLSAGITIPTGVVLQGSPPCVLQYTATSNTTMITMGESCRLEDFTIVLTSLSHYTLKGILFSGTSTSTSQLANIHLTVQNTSASSTGTSTVTGIECNGTGGLLSSSFAWNAIQSSTLKILSNGGGNKRGILISGSNVVSTRDTNVYVAPPPITTSTGSYVGIETNDSSNTGAIQIRTSSIGTIPPSGSQSYTASDILQTTPSPLLPI